MNIFRTLEKIFAKSRELIRKRINALSEGELISEWQNTIDDIWGPETIKEMKTQIKTRNPNIQFDDDVLTKSLYISYTKLAIILLEEYIVRDNQSDAN